MCLTTTTQDRSRGRQDTAQVGTYTLTSLTEQPAQTTPHAFAQKQQAGATRQDTLYCHHQLHQRAAVPSVASAGGARPRARAGSEASRHGPRAKSALAPAQAPLAHAVGLRPRARRVLAGKLVVQHDVQITRVLRVGLARQRACPASAARQGPHWHGVRSCQRHGSLSSESHSLLRALQHSMLRAPGHQN